MLIKLTLLFVALIAIILAIYKAADMESDMDHKYIYEFCGMTVCGAALYIVGIIICFATGFCGCGDAGVRIGITLIAAGGTMFAEPFIRYFIENKFDSKRY